MATTYIDLGYLRQAVSGNKSLMSELLTIFIDQATVIGDQLKDFLSKEDYDALAREAHKFKSTALSMGMSQAADSLKRIEVIAKKLYVRSPQSGNDESAKRLYIGQIRGLTPEIDAWTDQNLSIKSLDNLIEFCKLHSLKAAEEARNLLPKK